ncbi:MULTISPECIES: hypothetical protein [Thalassolituus]|jgi:hypothetical protein|uniref:hypothetical protein n=1 Tax=Thalassolituus TaxID=187492 RepID=UPI000C4ED5D5|nr:MULTISPECIES: hypothetical protein [Thalassolituus]MAY15401.1 hypothetical protein [Oceanospirillaceae bacterium]MCB2386716.1 hypothetical protein [Thalassolituus alkanivorans]MCB2422895.1 hypothetical protein [Thalassolituus alkanivorans]|tara:strand:- start:779 stop:2158 length:1380 start_codon:yes stop_codon:yes gene_type:complete
MELKKNYLALAVISAALVGCGGDDNNSKKNIAGVSCLDNVCTLKGQITEDVTLTADKEWRLDGFVTIGAGNVDLADAAAVAAAKAAGVTLTIQPGVHVQALNTGVLLVTRGSKLMAEGTAANPITFSSYQDADFDGLGEWGGVVIQGFAPQYGQGDTGACFGTGTVCNVDGEGGDGIGKFGGNDAADNSGVIKYVRIAEAGRVAGPNNEINGLTLQGVGHGTVIDYIQVHNNLDDGIEWFGGTVNVTHAVLTNNDDDDIDFDEGYKGNVQYALIVKNQDPEANPSGSNDPRGIEGNSDIPKETSATQAAIANVTIVGGAINDGQPGIKLRGKVNTSLAKVAVTGFASGCLEVKTSQATDVSVQDVICGGTALKNDAPATGSIIETSSSMTFNDKWAVQNAEATANTITTDFTAVNNGSSFAFDATTYAGAVDPAATTAWWAGWTIPGSLDGATAVNAPL